MGDIADMMVDGAMCQSCGAYLGGSTGYARFCGSCGGGDEHSGRKPRPSHWKPKRKKKSSDCGLLISGMGEIQVVNPKQLDTLPLGTCVYCTPGDLRAAADMIQAGKPVETIVAKLKALLAGRGCEHKGA